MEFGCTHKAYEYEALISILPSGPGLLYLLGIWESHKCIKSVFLLFLIFPFLLLLSFILQFIIRYFSQSLPILWTFSFSLFSEKIGIFFIKGVQYERVFVYFCFQCLQNGNPEDKCFMQVYTSIQIHAGAETHLPSLSISWFYFIFCNYTILFFPLQSTFLGHDFHYIIGNMTAIFFLQHWQKLIKKVLVLASLNFIKF